MKKCKCGCDLVEGAFYKSKPSVCKECLKARVKSYKENNPESVKASQKKYRAKNRDKLVQADKDRYWSDPETHRESAKQRYHANAEQNKKTQKSYRENNAELLRERNRRRRARERGSDTHFTEQEWQALLRQYGSACMNPDCRSVENLTRDHVVPLCQGGSDGIENIQILCGRCNSSKGTRVIDYRNLTLENTESIIAT